MGEWRLEGDVGACCPLRALGMRVEGMWFHRYCMMKVRFGRHVAQSAVDAQMLCKDIEIASAGHAAYVPLSDGIEEAQR